MSWCTIRLEEDNNRYSACLEAMVTSFVDLINIVEPLQGTFKKSTDLLLLCAQLAGSLGYAEVPDVLTLMSYLNSAVNGMENLLKSIKGDLEFS